MTSRGTSLLHVLIVAICGTLITAAVCSYTVWSVGPVDNAPLENINGIAYPDIEQVSVITESFAHTDVLLNSSRFGKALRIYINFNPGNATKLAVAVRENSFWFSYHPVTFYDASLDGPVKDTMNKTITIPLTDKIQDKDQSVDVIFFAQNAATPITPDHDRTRDTVTWQLHNLEFTTIHAPVSVAEAKQFLRRLIHKERPI